MMVFHTNYEELIGVAFAIKISLQRGDVTCIHFLLWQARQTREKEFELEITRLNPPPPHMLSDSASHISFVVGSGDKHLFP